jgi:parallel beta-helix repeat protein
MKRIALFALAALVLPVSACHEKDEDEQVTWYVNSTIGSDGSSGEFCCPLRTIREAMDRADKNDVIFVEPGSYTAATGESFPIVVKAFVTIEGNIALKGADTFVQGGGNYTVAGGTQASTVVNTTFLLLGNARLRGIKVTNTGGTGVVLENATAFVEFNTITLNTGDGIALFQGGAAAVTNNVVLSNGGNGIQVYDTGAPVLRGNDISSNSSEGMRTHDQSVPDLGTPSSFGNNTLQGNGGVGLFHNGNSVPGTISAVGNIWNASIQGANSSGGYATSTQTGQVALTAGNNFAITTSGTEIGF